MGKTTGLGDNFYVDGYDLSGDVNAVKQIASPLATLDVTDITQSAHERKGGKRDGMIDWVSLFDAAAGHEHPVLDTQTTSDRIISYFRGTAIGNPAACILAKQTDYAPTRGEDGSLLVDVTSAANGKGLEWGKQLTAGKRTDTTATTGTNLDTTAEVDFGAQGYLQVFAFSGTDCTVKIQHSADGVTSWGDLITFTIINGGNPAPNKERKATTATAAVYRYLRATTTTSAGFTSITFAVVVVKNKVAVVF